MLRRAVGDQKWAELEANALVYLRGEVSPGDELAMTALLALFGLGTADTVVLGLIPAAAYLGLHTVESNLVTPSILGARFTVSPVMILIALSYFSWIWGVLGALLSVPLLLILTALFEHIGRPNLVGFVFGEPLFPTSLDRLELYPDSADGERP